MPPHSRGCRSSCVCGPTRIGGDMIGYTRARKRCGDATRSENSHKALGPPTQNGGRTGGKCVLSLQLKPPRSNVWSSKSNYSRSPRPPSRLVGSSVSGNAARRGPHRPSCLRSLTPPNPDPRTHTPPSFDSLTSYAIHHVLPRHLGDYAMEARPADTFSLEPHSRLAAAVAACDEERDMCTLTLTGMCASSGSPSSSSQTPLILMFCHRPSYDASSAAHPISTALAPNLHTSMSNRSSSRREN